MGLGWTEQASVITLVSVLFLPQRKFTPAKRKGAVLRRFASLEVRFITSHLVTRLTVTSVLLCLEVAFCKKFVNLSAPDYGADLFRYKVWETTVCSICWRTSKIPGRAREPLYLEHMFWYSQFFTELLGSCGLNDIFSLTPETRKLC